MFLYVIVGWPFNDQVRPRAMNRLAVNRHGIGDVPRVEARAAITVRAPVFSQSDPDRLLRKIGGVIFLGWVAFVRTTGRRRASAGEQRAAVRRLRAPGRAEAATALRHRNVVTVKDGGTRMFVAPARPRQTPLLAIDRSADGFFGLDIEDVSPLMLALQTLGRRPL